MAKKWIQKAIKHPGALHRKLHVPKGKKIPAKMLEIQPGDSAAVKREKNLAKTLRKLHKKGK